MKDGGWIPIDKRLCSLLPKNGEYSFIEAYISYRIDVDNNCENSINGYSRMWSWSRNKVRNFIEGLRTGKGHVVDNQRTGKGQEIRLIINDLQQCKDKQGTGSGQARDRQGTTTIKPDTNTKPNTKTKIFIPPSVKEVDDYMTEINFMGDADQFVDFYTSKNWFVGRNKMKDWKAAVRTWKRSDYNKGKRAMTTFADVREERGREQMRKFVEELCVL